MLLSVFIAWIGFRSWNKPKKIVVIHSSIHSTGYLSKLLQMFLHPDTFWKWSRSQYLPFPFRQHSFAHTCNKTKPCSVHGEEPTNLHASTKFSLPSSYDNSLIKQARVIVTHLPSCLICTYSYETAAIMNKDLNFIPAINPHKEIILFNIIRLLNLHWNKAETYRYGLPVNSICYIPT